MRTGLANMGLGLLIAAVGALVTGLTYSMVSHGGGTYVVATGAFVVGAWRFLLGLFQLVRGAVGGPDAERIVSAPANSSARPDVPRTDVSRTNVSRSAAPARTDAARTQAARTDAEPVSSALHIIGGVLIAEAVLRLVFVCLLLSRVPFAAMLNSLLFLLTGLVLPVGLVIGGLVAGTLLLRHRPGAIPFGIGLCAIGLLFQAFGLVLLLSRSAFHVPPLTWALLAVHVAVYSAGLIVLMRSLGPQKFSAASAGDHANVSPGIRS